MEHEEAPRTVTDVVREALFAYKHGDMETCSQILKRGAHTDGNTPAELLAEIVKQSGGNTGAEGEL